MDDEFTPVRSVKLYKISKCKLKNLKINKNQTKHTHVSRHDQQWTSCSGLALTLLIVYEQHRKQKRKRKENDHA